MDNAEFIRRETESLRSVGLLEPINEGFWTELGQGWLLGFNQAMRGVGATAKELQMGSGMYDYWNSVLHTNQQWNPYEGYSILSLNLGNLGRTLGYGLGAASPILIPLALIGAWFAVKKFRKNLQLRRVVRAERAKKKDAARVQALQELESGNFDPLAKAKAVERSRGDAALAKSLYLKERVEDLMKQ